MNRLPRKLKKAVKSKIGCHYPVVKDLGISNLVWAYRWHVNPKINKQKVDSIIYSKHEDITIRKESNNG